MSILSSSQAEQEAIFTAAKMIVSEPLLADVFDETLLRWATYAVAIVGVLAAGAWASRQVRNSVPS